MHARWTVGCFAQGCAQGGLRAQAGNARARARVARVGFESADTHEAVELPAGVAALHTALAQVDRDNLTHLFFRLEKEWCNVQAWDELAFGLLWEVFVCCLERLGTLQTAPS